MCQRGENSIDLQSLPTFKQSFINHKTSQCSTRLSRGELAALKFLKLLDNLSWEHQLTNQNKILIYAHGEEEASVRIDPK